MYLASELTDIHIHIYGLLLWPGQSKNLSAMQETRVWSLGWDNPLEKGMATHSNTFAWRTPWREEPDRLHTVHGITESDPNEQLTHTHTHAWCRKKLIKNILKIQGRNCQGEADKIVSCKQCLGFGRAEGKEGRKGKGRGRERRKDWLAILCLGDFICEYCNILYGNIAIFWSINSANLLPLI